MVRIFFTYHSLVIPMKPPRKPRPTAEISADVFRDPGRLAKVLGPEPWPATVDGAYLHWDDLRHRTPPEGLSHEEWWLRLKLARGATAEPIPLRDAGGGPFVVTSPPVLRQVLHEADRDLSGRREVPEQLTTEGVRDRYQMSALIEEAITSSQLEGAATTRRVANEMLRSGRRPRTHDERMIFNNFEAMEFVRSIQDRAMTPELVFRIHRIVTDDTLDDSSACGRLRTEVESGHRFGVYFDDVLVHSPPPAAQLEDRLSAFCAFANGGADGPFVHPIVRSVLLHFWIGFDHPFVDGNGRTARALFYWSMLHHGYWLAEFLSVSHILRGAPAKYVRAYLRSETDGNDATYFVLDQVDVLRRAIDALLEYVRTKAADVRRTQEIVRHSTLNHRQIALLGHALCNPDTTYEAKRHAASHRVSRQTALTDLKELAGYDLLTEGRRGRAFVFSVPADLDQRLRALGTTGELAPVPRGPGRPPRPSNQRRLIDE